MNVSSEPWGFSVGSVIFSLFRPSGEREMFVTCVNHQILIAKYWRPRFQFVIFLQQIPSTKDSFQSRDPLVRQKSLSEVVKSDRIPTLSFNEKFKFSQIQK